MDVIHLAQKVYAIHSPLESQGIYRNWKEVHPLIHRKPGAAFKSFWVLEDAERFVKEGPDKPVKPSQKRKRTNNNILSSSNKRLDNKPFTSQVIDQNPVRPVHQTRWLRQDKAKSRPNESVMEMHPEFQKQVEQAPAGPACLSLLKRYNDQAVSVAQVYLFASRSEMHRFLSCIQRDADRTFFAFMPDNRPLAFQLDLDKDDKDPCWEGHVTATLSEIKRALKTFIDRSYMYLTNNGKSAPKGLLDNSFDFKSRSKTVGWHIHTTKSCSDSNAFIFSNREKLRKLLKRMQVQVTESYYDKKDIDHQSALILANPIDQTPKSALKFLFDTVGSTNQQWRLGLCCKPGKTPYVLQSGQDLNLLQQIEISDGIVPLDTVPKDYRFADSYYVRD